MRGKKGRNYAIHETGLSGNVVASFFPLIIFILLCFNVLSTVPRENRLADFLYIYIYIFFSFFNMPEIDTGLRDSVLLREGKVASAKKKY